MRERASERERERERERENEEKDELALNQRRAREANARFPGMFDSKANTKKVGNF